MPLRELSSAEICEGSSDLLDLESAAQRAENRGVVPADVEDLVALQVEILVQSTDEQLPWRL